MGGSRAGGRGAARVGIVAAVVVVASVAGYAVTRIDSGATAGPAAVEQADGRTAGRDGTTTPTTPATVPPTTPPPSAPATTAGGGRAPATTTPAPPATGGGGPVIAPPGRTEQWGLPQGKLSIDEEEERDVYNGFVDGCDIGRMLLESGWQQFRSPRNDFLFLAAVHVCRGDLDEGRRWFDRGGAEYGDEWANWGGVGGGQAACLTYRAVRSVLDNVPQASVTCPAAVPNLDPPTAGGPPWDDDPQHCDRPTTDADECAPTPVAAAG